MSSASLPPWLHPAPDSILAQSLRQGRPAWVEAIHLLWTVWVFVVPMFSPRGYDLLWLALTLVSYPLFVALYAGALLAPAHRVGVFAAGMIALCLALLPWYPSGLSYFVFGCVMLGGGSVRSLWRYLLLILLFNGLLIVYARLLGYPWMSLAWMPVTTLVVSALIHVERKDRRRAAALRLSHEEVRRLAALAERERIGRDLHDLLGHTLSMVALKSDLALRLLDRDAPAARREMEDVAKVARDALAQVRTAVSGIRAADIAAELAAARLLLETDGIGFSCSVDPALSGWRFADGAEAALALAIREAVINIQRHAGARVVEVSLRVEDGQAVLGIADDGRGGPIVPGNGLSGMRERLQGAGGLLRIDSRPGRGTRIEAGVPLLAA